MGRGGRAAVSGQKERRGSTDEMRRAIPEAAS
jgi:hypothetical protein